AGRGAAPGGPRGGGRAAVSRGLEAVPGKRLVAVRTGTGAARAGEERRGGGCGRPLWASVGRSGRDAHGVPLLGRANPPLAHSQAAQELVKPPKHPYAVPQLLQVELIVRRVRTTVGAADSPS